ncbi:hypothetical protein BD414DRAFT_453628, partial [Trametes punicea]
MEERRERLMQGCSQLLPLGRRDPSRNILSPSRSQKTTLQVPDMKPAVIKRAPPQSPRLATMSVGSSLAEHPPLRPRTLRAEGSASSVPPRRFLPRITAKDWSVPDLCNRYEKFKEVRRVSALSARAELAKVLEEYEKDGFPLIIEDWHKHPKWRHDIFSLEWLLSTIGNQQINVRNVHDRQDKSMTLLEFVEKSRSQSCHSVPGEGERLYWKDADCPPEWRDWLLKSGAIPSNVLPGSPDDYLGYLFPSEAVETLLCYMGIGDTYTAAHKDLCASSGHNLMCFSEHDGSSFWFMTAANDALKVAEYFQKTLKHELDWETHITTVEQLGNAPFTVYIAEQKVGDLVLVPPRSCHQVVNSGGLAMKASWSRMTLDNIETALHCELPIYRRVCRPEQYRVKTILYRSMLHLTDALQTALTCPPKPQANEAREWAVTLDEDVVPGLTNSYPLNELVNYSTPTAEGRRETPIPPPDACQRARLLKRLVRLFDEVLRDEFASCHVKLKHILAADEGMGWTLSTTSAARQDEGDGPRLSPSGGGRLILQPPANVQGRRHIDRETHRSKSYTIACDFCGADLFQSFFECKRCWTSEGALQLQVGDGLLLCPACYVEGRSCDCGEMEPAQCRPFDTLLFDRNQAMQVLSRILPLGEHIQQLEKRDLLKQGEVCIFEAACALYQRRQEEADKRFQQRRCRPQSKDLHDMIADAGLNCAICHGAKCFRHLLREGTHAARAIIEHRRPYNGCKSYHDVHRANYRAMEKVTLFDLDGVQSVEERLLVAALSFRNCRPGHSKVKLGWYDLENNPLDVPADDASSATHSKETTDPTVNTQLDFEPCSPLTPVDSDGSQFDDSPHGAPEDLVDVMQLSRRQSVSSHMTADEEDVIEIVYSDPPSLTVRSGACYVSLPPLPAYVPERKRPSSPSLEPSQPSSKKPRAAHVDDPEDDGHAVTAEVQIRRPKISRAVRPYLVSTRPSRPNPSMQSSADEDSRQASPIDEAN